MKKILFVLAAIALIGSGLTAADLSGDALALKATIEGDASFTFGFNLDPKVAGGSERVHGIANAASGTVKVTLISKRTHTEKGEGEVYAEITLKDIESIETAKRVQLNADSGTNTNDLTSNGGFGNIEAKIYLGPIVLNVLGVKGDIDFAKVGAGYNAGLLFIDNYAGFSIDDPNQFNGFSVSLKDTTMIKFEAGVNTKYTYVDGANAANVYNYYATVGLGTDILKGLSFDVAVNYTTDAYSYTVPAIGFTSVTYAPLGLGVKAAYEMPVMEGYTLKVGAGLDFLAESWKYSFLGSDVVGTDTLMQIGAGVAFVIPGDVQKDKEYFGLGKKDYNPGVSLGWQVGLTNSLATFTGGTATSSFEVSPMSFNVSVFDAGLIPVLDLLAVVEWDTPYNYQTVTSTGTTTTYATVPGELAYAVRASAKIEEIAEISAEFVSIARTIGGNVNIGKQSVAVNDEMRLKVGVDLTPIKLTKITLAYTSGDLLRGPTYATSAANDKGLGVVELTVKVSF